MFSYSFNSGMACLSKVVCMILLSLCSLNAQNAAQANEQFEQGNEAFWSGNYPSAVKLYTSAIRLDTTQADFYLNRGKAYFQMRKYPQAITDFSKVIAKAPYSSKAYNMRGRAKYILKDYDGAIADYDIGAALQKKRGGKSLIGWEHALEGEVAEACFNWVMQLQEGYDNQYDINAIRHWTQKAIQADTLSADFQVLAQETIGMTYFSQENYDAALKHLGKADQLLGALPIGSPYTMKYLPALNFNLYYVYAGILLNTGKFDPAIQLFEQLSQIDSTKHLPLFALSQAHYHKGDIQKALFYLENALNKGLLWNQLILAPDYYEGLQPYKKFQELAAIYDK